MASLARRRNFLSLSPFDFGLRCVAGAGAVAVAAAPAAADEDKH